MSKCATLKIIFCQSCGQGAVSSNAVFCSACGAKIVRTIHKLKCQCGAKFLISGKKDIYCTECGCRIC